MPIVTYPFTATCDNCGKGLLFDIDTDGTPGKNGDWRSLDDDYGCEHSPDTDDDGTGGHKPTDIIYTV